MIPILGGLITMGAALVGNPAAPAPDLAGPPPIVLARHHHHHWRHHWGRYSYRYRGAPAPDYPAAPGQGYAAPESGSTQPAPAMQPPPNASRAAEATAPPAGPKIEWVDPPGSSRKR